MGFIEQNLPSLSLAGVQNRRIDMDRRDMDPEEGPQGWLPVAVEKEMH